MAKKKIFVITRKKKKKKKIAIVRIFQNKANGQLLCTVPKRSGKKQGDYIKLDLSKL